MTAIWLSVHNFDTTTKRIRSFTCVRFTGSYVRDLSCQGSHLVHVLAPGLAGYAIFSLPGARNELLHIIGYE